MQIYYVHTEPVFVSQFGCYISSRRCNWWGKWGGGYTDFSELSCNFLLIHSAFFFSTKKVSLNPVFQLVLLHSYSRLNDTHSPWKCHLSEIRAQLFTNCTGNFKSVTEAFTLLWCLLVSGQLGSHILMSLTLSLIQKYGFGMMENLSTPNVCGRWLVLWLNSSYYVTIRKPQPAKEGNVVW